MADRSARATAPSDPRVDDADHLQGETRTILTLVVALPGAA